MGDNSEIPKRCIREIIWCVRYPVQAYLRHTGGQFCIYYVMIGEIENLNKVINVLQRSAASREYR